MSVYRLFHFWLETRNKELFHKGYQNNDLFFQYMFQSKCYADKKNLLLSPYSTALSQAIHVWKEALKYEYDDLIEKFWNVPLDIMKYMANVKPITEDEYAPIRQLAKETKPAFDRLFPDPAPRYSRFSLIWLLYDWDEFWEAVGDDRKRSAQKKERLNFYLNYKF